MKEATAAGGAALMAAGAEAAGSAAAPGRPGRAEVARAYERERAYQALVRRPVYKPSLTPHWFGDDTHFWYSNSLAGGEREFLLVDAVRGVRGPAFDHHRLAAALSQASGQAYQGATLPFETISFAEGPATVRFDAAGKAWQCDLTSYTVTPLPPGTEPVAPEPSPGDGPPEDKDGPPTPPDAPQVSPDGRWTALLRDGNVYVRDSAGAEKALSRAGTPAQPFDALTWSPDSQTLVGYQVTPVPIKKVYLVESSPPDGGTRGVLHEHEYAQPGDPFSRFEMWLFDPAAGTATPAQVPVVDFGDPPGLRWDKDGRRFTYEYMDRGYRRFRVIAVDAPSGRSVTLVDDQAQTFIDSTNVYLWYAEDGGEILYASERDGWRHLYLCDGRTGALKSQVTRGEWVVRDVDHVDEAGRQVWFAASGRNAAEDPYHLHHYRVNFDGSGLTALTAGDGTHEVQPSPGRKFLIDSYSRADLPPVHTLRRAADGAHVCDLERADVSDLLAAGWRMPEVFRAKGRDGRTDIWGVVFRPLTLDPAEKYPIIENIYAGPQDSFVRKTFAVRDGMQALAELGFVVVQCDGMGTRNRSKAFHDVCWRNIKDGGFPDRIAWIRALAAKYPYMDADRVGIYGTSAGGQNSTGALLFHPEFYKVGVSSCGCHDNRIDKQWWNEQWMGYPVGPWYADNSNITHAAALRGKLLLIVGELDTNVPPESTIRLTNALINAGKDYELIIIPGSDHTSGGPYGERRRRDFFVRHLLGVEPPDRNVPRPPLPTLALAAHPPGDAALASADGGADTTVEFRNGTGQPVRLFWLAGGKKQTPYGDIAPGAARSLHTYAGHFWLVTSEAGRALAVFIAEENPGVAEVH